jgi:alkylation response protein AidB-like acyl-CoA dehydrogenase
MDGRRALHLPRVSRTRRPVNLEKRRHPIGAHHEQDAIVGLYDRVCRHGHVREAERRCDADGPPIEFVIEADQGHQRVAMRRDHRHRLARYSRQHPPVPHDMENGGRHQGIDNHLAQKHGGEERGIDEEVIQSATASTDHDDPLRLSGNRGHESQFEVRAVLSLGVYLELGPRLFGFCDQVRRGGIEVPHHEIHGQPDVVGHHEPRISRDPKTLGQKRANLGRHRVPSGEHDNRAGHGCHLTRLAGHDALIARDLSRSRPARFTMAPPCHACGSRIGGAPSWSCTVGTLGTVFDMDRTLFNEDHQLFRASFRKFVEKEITPHHLQWEQEGIVPRELFLAAGAAGYLCMAVPEQYGGAGVDDFRFNTVIAEEIQRAGVAGSGLGITLHNDITLPYVLRRGSDEQKARWLPGMASGELITAIAMTEPGTGSDLAGIRTTAIGDGAGYVVNGSKTFITNGINADLVITAVKTDPAERHRGLSLIGIEAGMDGFERGRNLEKMGLHAQDTAELFFSDVHVPATNLLGQEGQGFVQLVQNLPQERLSVAIGGLAAARQALDWTLEYCQGREAFGQPIGSFQNSRFKLAEMKTEIEIGQAFADQCVVALVEEQLTAEEAAMAKWWCTELQKRVVDECVQLHGGYGYMLEYPIARAYLDARVQTIYAGTTEIMKEIIGRSLGV